VQIGKVLGAKVIAVARGKEKCSFLQQLGADLVIDSVRVPMLWAILVLCGPSSSAIPPGIVALLEGQVLASINPLVFQMKHR